MKKEMMARLAGTVAPLGDSELEKVTGGGKRNPDAGAGGIQIEQYTYSYANGVAVDCSDFERR